MICLGGISYFLLDGCTHHVDTTRRIILPHRLLARFDNFGFIAGAMFLAQEN